jgi:Uma2 family endonuclease
MSALPSTHLVTLDEFERLPDIDGIQELLDGEVVALTAPKRRHSQVWLKVFDILRLVIHPSRVWSETGFVIGNHVLQPDVAVIFPDQGMDRDWFAGAPMIAIEVASRGNTPDQIEWKKDQYLASGAHEVWILYDKTRTAVVHLADGTAIRYRDQFTSQALQTVISVIEIFT